MVRFYYGGSSPDPNKKMLSPGYSFLQTLYGRWWMMLLEGSALIGAAGVSGWFAVMDSEGASTFPLIIISVLGAVLACFGVAYLIFGMVNRHKGKPGGLLIFRAVVQIMFGLQFFLAPGFAASFLTIIVGLWALFTGIPMVFSRRGFGGRRWLQLLAGVVLGAAGVVLLFSPLKTLLVLSVIFAVVLGVFGIYLIINSFGMRKAVNAVESEERGFTDYTIE